MLANFEIIVYGKFMNRFNSYHYELIVTGKMPRGIARSDMTYLNS
jgi:hypothetical protein